MCNFVRPSLLKNSTSSFFLSSRAACVGVRHLVRVSLLWISGALRSLFCLDSPSTFLRFWPGHRQPRLGPKDLWHWIPFEIFRSDLTILFLPSHGRKVFSYITRKMSLIYILCLLMPYELNSIITAPSIDSISFNSSPKECLIDLGSAWGLKVKLRPSVLRLFKMSDRKSW